MNKYRRFYVTFACMSGGKHYFFAGVVEYGDIHADKVWEFRADAMEQLSVPDSSAILLSFSEVAP